MDTEAKRHLQFLKFRHTYQLGSLNKTDGDRLQVIKDLLEVFVESENGWDVVGEDRPAYVYAIGYALRLACNIAEVSQLATVLNNYVLLLPDWLCIGALWFSGNDVCKKTLKCYVSQAPDMQFRLTAKQFLKIPVDVDAKFSAIPLSSYGKVSDQERHNTIARWFILGEPEALDAIFDRYVGDDTRNLLRNPGPLVGRDLVLAANALCKAPDMLWFVRDAEVDPLVKEKVKQWLA